LLERLDLLADRLLGDVQVLRGTREAPPLRDGREVAHLAELRRQDVRVYARTTSGGCRPTTTSACWRDRAGLAFEPRTEGRSRWQPKPSTVPTSTARSWT